MNRKQGLGPRTIVPILALVTGLVGAGLFAAGYGGAGVARGTSEALGYPTNTSTVISGPTPIVPSSTATPIPPTPTVVPPSPTRPAPTGTATPVSPTQTPTVTATSTPSKAPVALQLSAKSVQRGDRITIQVRTLPGLAIRAVVRYPALTVRTVLTAHTDPRGVATLRITVTQGPSQGQSSLAGIMRVTASGPGRVGSADAAFTVYQSIHLVTSAKVVSQHGKRQLLVSVGVARPAAITISVLLSRGGHGAIVAHGQATHKGTVTIQLPLPKVSDSATAHITVTILTREGVREISKSAVAVIS